MDILGVELTVASIVTVDNIINLAKWIFSAILIKGAIYLIQFKDSRINKLYSYYEKHKNLKNDLKENQDSFQINISIEMLESIEKNATKVNDAKLRSVFLYVLNNYHGKTLNKYNLKGLLKYIIWDGTFQIDLDEFFYKQYLYKVCFFISLLAFMLSPVLFVFSFMGDSLVLKGIAGLFLVISESATIILFDKIIGKRKITKYNNALAEIDASAFKPD